MTEATQNSGQQPSGAAAGASAGASAGADGASAATAGAKEKIIDPGAAAAAGAGAGAEGGDGKPVQSPWPEQWRDLLASDDKKFRKQLDRYASPLEFANKTRALEAKFSSGEYKRDLPEGATEEEVKAWRKERGLPAEAAEFVKGLALPNGVVLSDSDKPVAESFAQAAMTMNINGEQYNKALAWYYDQQDKMAAALSEADAQYHDKSVDDLRLEWTGADYRRNVNAVNNLLGVMPDDIRQAIIGARTPDGKLLGDYVPFIKQMAQWAVELNPASTLVPGASGDPGKTIESELAEIRKFRVENPDKYDSDKAMQARELDLLNAKGKMKGRADRAA